MAIEGGPESACIDENTALDFVQGRLAAGIVCGVDEHADGCPECRVLLNEAVRSFRDRATLDVPLGHPLVTVFTRGDALAGRYRVTRFIARGGMGEVYEAEDLLLGTRLAVKTMNAAISDDPGAMRRLKQEVNLARRITHPNVCRIFDIGIHEPTNPRPGERVLFLTMELIDGVSLGERLRLGGAIPLAEARPIIATMLAALGAAHRAGVVHRDFKSDNVMLATGEPGEPARVVIMDFGLAHEASMRTGTGAPEAGLTGTLAYMAPEQLESRPTGPATDIYALGIVMFEMLTGQLPFDGEPPLGGAIRRLVEEAPSLRTKLPGIDPTWEGIVAQCLQREPEQRPASTDEVLEAIGEWPAPIGRTSTPLPVRKKASPLPSTISGRVASAVVAAGGAAIVALQILARDPKAPAPARAIDPLAVTQESSPPRPLPPPSGADDPRTPRRLMRTPVAVTTTGVAAAAAESAGVPQAQNEPEDEPAGHRPHANRGNARGRRALARPTLHAHAGRREPTASDVAAVPELPGAEPAGDPGPPRLRSQDPEDGFIFLR